MSFNLILGLTMGALVCALPVLCLKRNRQPYMLGLAASIAVSVVTALIPGSGSQQLDIVIIGPAIEEAVRVLFLFVLPFALLKSTATKWAWLAFGIAFGGFELCLKWLDLAATWSDAPRDANDVTSPVVPFLMHIALTLGALWLHQERNKHAVSVWTSLLAVHVLHNWSVFRFDLNSSAEVDTVLGFVRMGIFGIAIWWLLTREGVRRPD